VRQPDDPSLAHVRKIPAHNCARSPAGYRTGIGHSTRNREPMPNDSFAPEPGIRARLEDVSRGLLYTSESDRPFTFVSVPRPAGELTPASFAAAVGAPAGTSAGETSLDAFLARHIERAPAGDPAMQALRPKYEALKAALRQLLSDVRVFRVGDVEVRCFAVGDDGRGHLAGLETVAVET
jgi:histidine triad (HIT) family protein